MPAPAPAKVMPALIGKPSAYITEDPSSHTDEIIHAVDRGADNHSDHQEDCANDGNPPSTDQVRQTADERAHSSQGQKVCNNDPSVAFDIAEVTIDVGKDAAKQIYRYLGACPQESHGYEGHVPFESHLVCFSPGDFKASDGLSYRRLMVMVLRVTVCSQAVFLVVIVVARDSLDCAYLVYILDVPGGRVFAGFHFNRFRWR